MKELRVPNIGEYVKNLGTLVNVETIPPKPQPPSKDYIFEEINAEVEVRLKDEVLKGLGSFNDFYGIGTSVTAAIKEAEEYALSRNITADSDLEVVVIKVVSRYRAKPVYGTEGHFYAPDIYQFKHLDIGSKRDVGEPVESIVWSSRCAACDVPNENCEVSLDGSCWKLRQSTSSTSGGSA